MALPRGSRISISFEAPDRRELERSARLQRTPLAVRRGYETALRRVSV